VSIKITLAGPRGKMGSEALQMIQDEPNFTLVACIDRKHDGKLMKDINTLPDLNVPIFTDPEECFKQISTDVLLDLTVPDVCYRHARLALMHNVRPVVGTTGFTDDELEQLKQLATEHQIGGIIAPNFATGAILMMKFAQLAAKFFPDVEIIEKHHDQKLDAPSGTAIKTSELIRQVREDKVQGHPDEYETIERARGANVDGFHIHSLRLPGLVAHQEVIFGSPGQTLSIKHDSLNRQSFMDGAKLAIHQVIELNELVYGLENIPYFNES